MSTTMPHARRTVCGFAVAGLKTVEHSGIRPTCREPAIRHCDAMARAGEGFEERSAAIHNEPKPSTGTADAALAWPARRARPRREREGWGRDIGAAGDPRIGGDAQATLRGSFSRHPKCR